MDDDGGPSSKSVRYLVAPGTKRCGKCKIEKSKSDFSKDKSRRDGLNYRCKECATKHSAQWRARDLKRNADVTRRWRKRNPKRAQLSDRKQNYSWAEDPHSIGAIVDAATHCELCNRTNCKLYPDHDHETNELRGILCARCNTGLGKLGDNIEGLTRALNYLRRQPSINPHPLPLN